MSGNLADFSGNIPQNYDTGMGPVIFAGYAADIAQRTASLAPSNVFGDGFGDRHRHSCLARRIARKHAANCD